MRTTEEIRQLATQFWTEEAFANEAALRLYARVVHTELHKLCQAWDLEGVEDWLAVYRYAEPRCREEPFATAYEFSLMLITLSIASTHAAMGSFDTLYVLAEQILGMLREGDERRARLGLMERGNSQIRYHIYCSLAQAKWEGKASERDRLMTVEDTAVGYCCAADRALTFLAQNPDHDPDNVLEALALDGVDIAAMLYRWYYEKKPDRVTPFIEWHNSRSEAKLAVEIGHCFSHAPLAEHASYWTYEIAKLHLAGVLTKEMLETCHAKRMATVLNTISEPRHVAGMYGCWERQNLMMLSAINERAHLAEH